MVARQPRRRQLHCGGLLLQHGGRELSRPAGPNRGERRHLCALHRLPGFHHCQPCHSVWPVASLRWRGPAQHCTGRPSVTPAQHASARTVELRARARRKGLGGCQCEGLREESSLRAPARSSATPSLRVPAVVFASKGTQPRSWRLWICVSGSGTEGSCVYGRNPLPPSTCALCGASPPPSTYANGLKGVQCQRERGVGKGAIEPGGALGRA